MSVYTVRPMTKKEEIYITVRSVHCNVQSNKNLRWPNVARILKFTPSSGVGLIMSLSIRLVWILCRTRQFRRRATGTESDEGRRHVFFSMFCNYAKINKKVVISNWVIGEGGLWDRKTGGGRDRLWKSNIWVGNRSIPKKTSEGGSVYPLPYFGGSTITSLSWNRTYGALGKRPAEKTEFILQLNF